MISYQLRKHCVLKAVLLSWLFHVFWFHQLLFSVYFHWPITIETIWRCFHGTRNQNQIDDKKNLLINYSTIAGGDKGDQEMCHRSCKHNWWCWSGLPWSILRTLPRPCVWVKILQVRSFLLILRTFCTGTCHCRAQEHIDNQHDEEQNTKSYAEIQKPNWCNSTSLTNIRNFN